MALRMSKIGLVVVNYPLKAAGSPVITGGVLWHINIFE
jgi:hypothetical protein